jgi:hypothetical protein
MRKYSVLLAIVLAAAVSTSADAAKKKGHRAAASVTVGNTGGPMMDATDPQRAKFFQDAWFPAGAK